MERDYSHIKARVSRTSKGFLCCDLLTLDDEFILQMVTAKHDETEAELIQTALRCLSKNDLALANEKVA